LIRELRNRGKYEEASIILRQFYETKKKNKNQLKYELGLQQDKVIRLLKKKSYICVCCNNNVEEGKTKCTDCLNKARKVKK
jgi:uncharacterized protein YjgD (DUF1641 family)